jgi:hypothetical protein
LAWDTSFERNNKMDKSLPPPEPGEKTVSGTTLPPGDYLLAAT